MKDPHCGPRLSWWNRVVVSGATHRVMATPEIAATRREVLTDISGSVVELGFGSGLSLECYPPAVTHVRAIDPDDAGWERSATARTAAARRGLVVERLGRDAQAMPLADGSVDTVVTMWTLCTVPSLELVLAEIARVLRPGGVFVFAEHGPSSRASRRRFESIVEPVWRPLAGGCHLTREPWVELKSHAFADVSVRRPTLRSGLPPGTRVGRAVR
jgi:SAM-dependent methyltransferase